MFRKKFEELRRLFDVSGAPTEVANLPTQLGNIGHLLTGNFLGAGVAIAAMAFAARAIGPAEFGILALAMALTQAIERILSFQTWQPLIRYGSGLMDGGRQNDFKKLIKIAFLLDLCTAVSGWLIAVAIIFAGREFLEWGDRSVQSALIYACVLLTNINGTPIGVLRLAGRFREVAYLQLISMSVRLLFSVIGFALGWGLIAFTIVWAGTAMLNALLLLGLGVNMLRKDALLDFVKAPLNGISETFDGFWKFTIGANLSLMARSAPQQLDTLLVGALTTAEAAGFYHIAKRFGKLAEQAGHQIQSVVYPDIAKLWSSGLADQVKRVFLRTEIAMVALCVLGVGLTILMAPLGVRLLVGDDYAAASGLVVLQICAVSLLLIGSTARSGVLSAGRTNALLGLSCLTTVVFFAVAVFLVPRMGAMGANIAHIIQQSVYLLSVTFLFYGALRELGRKPQNLSPENT